MRVLLVAVLALALAPAAAGAADYDVPIQPCSQAIGVAGVEQGGIYGRSELCSGTDYTYEVVTPPQHGLLSFGRRPFQNGPVVDWMYDTTYVPDPALPVGATDEWSWRIRDGDRTSAVLVTRIRIIPRGTINPIPPAQAVPAKPLAMTVSLGSKRRRAVLRHGLRLKVGCDVACTTAARLTYRGKPAGTATATAAGPLVVRLTGAARRARRPRLRLDVSATAASGATANRRVTLRLRG